MLMEMEMEMEMAPGKASFLSLARLWNFTRWWGNTSKQFGLGEVAEPTSVFNEADIPIVSSPLTRKSDNCCTKRVETKVMSQISDQKKAISHLSS